MAVPKRKKSRSRTRHRRSQWLRTAAPTMSTCPQCKQVMRPHVACPTCGTYRGRQAAEPTL